MIQKFRWKFIGMSIVALFLVLVITLSALLGLAIHKVIVRLTAF